MKRKCCFVSGFRPFLDSRYCSFLIVGLYPAIFLAGKNWFAYRGVQLVGLVFFTSVATLCAGSLFHLLCWALLTRLTSKRWALGKLSRRSETLQNVLSALFSCGLLVCLLQVSIFAGSDRLLLPVSVVVVITTGVLLFVAKVGFLPLNVAILAMTVLAASDWVLSFAGSHGMHEGAWYKGSKEEFRSIRFTQTPNVYAIVMESYHSAVAAKEIYGFDNKIFIAEVERRGVAVYTDAYANYYASLPSLSCMLAMQHHYYSTAIGNDDALGARDLIGGITYNPVLHVFKNNGYRCQYICSNDYIFRAGDIITYAYPWRTNAKVFELYRLGFLDAVLARCFRNYRPAGWGEVDMVIGEEEEFYEVSCERIRVAASSADPYFTLLFPWAVYHVPNDQVWTQLDWWEDEYPCLLEERSPVFLKLLDVIIDEDPSAVILMFGDHGANRYRGLSWHEKKRNINAVLAEEGVQGRRLALDQFGVFLGIRYPGSDPGRVVPLSNVNLFRRLFGVLSGEDLLLENAVTDESYTKRGKDLYVGVRDGIPLDIWEKVDPR